MKKETILAIDQGTTGSTALLFSHSGQICGRAYSEFSQHYPKPGWVEHDAEEIWQVSLQVMKQALDEAEITAHELAGIGITNQRETTVIWDRETGKPVAPAIVWQDRRTAERCAQLKADGHEKMFREKTGLVLDPYFSGTKVAWLLDQDPLLREQAEQGALAFGTIDSWLVWNLTGGDVHATDYSNASRTLLFNLHNLTWDEEILDLLDIPATLLPEVKPSSGIFGETTGDLFGAPIPIAGIAGDQQAALFGQACFEPGMSKNTYGTGCFMLTHTGTKPTEPSEGLLTTIAWGIGDEPVEYAIEGGIFITGAAIQWLRDGLGIIASAEETEEMAKSLDSNEGVYFVPALAGMGTPHWDPYARGTILGITRGTTRAHLVRATLEGIGFQVLDVVEAMEKATGTPIQTLRADGGAVANGFLMQFQSDLLDVPVEVPAISETTAFGAACLAGLAVGFWKDRAELSRIWQRAEQYKPDMSEKKRNALHRKWLDAVSRARDWAEE